MAIFQKHGLAYLGPPKAAAPKQATGWISALSLVLNQLCMALMAQAGPSSTQAQGLELFRESCLDKRTVAPVYTCPYTESLSHSATLVSTVSGCSEETIRFDHTESPHNPSFTALNFRERARLHQSYFSFGQNKQVFDNFFKEPLLMTPDELELLDNIQARCQAIVGKTMTVNTFMRTPKHILKALSATTDKVKQVTSRASKVLNPPTYLLFETWNVFSNLKLSEITLDQCRDEQGAFDSQRSEEYLRKHVLAGRMPMGEDCIDVCEGSAAVNHSQTVIIPYSFAHLNGALWVEFALANETFRMNAMLLGAENNSTNVIKHSLSTEENLTRFKNLFLPICEFHRAYQLKKPVYPNQLVPWQTMEIYPTKKNRYYWKQWQTASFWFQKQTCVAEKTQTLMDKETIFRHLTRSVIDQVDGVSFQAAMEAMYENDISRQIQQAMKALAIDITKPASEIDESAATPASVLPFDALAKTVFTSLSGTRRHFAANFTNTLTNNLFHTYVGLESIFRNHLTNEEFCQELFLPTLALQDRIAVQLTKHYQSSPTPIEAVYSMVCNSIRHQYQERLQRAQQLQPLSGSPNLIHLLNLHYLFLHQQFVQEAQALLIPAYLPSYEQHFLNLLKTKKKIVKKEKINETKAKYCWEALKVLQENLQRLTTNATGILFTKAYFTDVKIIVMSDFSKPEVVTYQLAQNSNDTWFCMDQALFITTLENLPWAASTRPGACRLALLQQITNSALAFGPEPLFGALPSLSSVIKAQLSKLPGLLIRKLRQLDSFAKSMGCDRNEEEAV